MPALRVATVVGVVPDKWLRRWAERHPELPAEHVVVEEHEQAAVLIEGTADLAIVRLPMDLPEAHVIRLYQEAQAAVVSKDHAAAAFDELTLADLATELIDASELSAADAMAVAGSGAGAALVPMPLARALRTRVNAAVGEPGIALVPVADAPATTIALVWLRERDDEHIQSFVGVVRGRTANSSRVADAQQAAPREARPAAKREAERGGAPRQRWTSRPHRAGSARQQRGRKHR